MNQIDQYVFAMIENQQNIDTVFRNRVSVAKLICLVGRGCFYDSVKNKVREINKLLMADCHSEECFDLDNIAECVGYEELDCFADSTKNLDVLYLLCDEINITAIRILRSRSIKNYIDCKFIECPYMFETQLMKKNRDNIFDVFKLLSDESSRSAYSAILRYRLEGDPFLIKQACYRQYLHPQIDLQLGEVVIDGGAYNGDTVVMMVDGLKNGRELYYHAFEPDPANVSSMIEMVEKNNLKQQVKIVNKGLWHSAAKLRFDLCNNPTSQIRADGLFEIEVIDIDSYVSETGIKVGYINMDIEAAEKEALEGARETIKKQRPCLAISVYHKATDLWELPLFIRDLCGVNYLYYFGHHRDDCWGESVFYAVPKI